MKRFFVPSKSKTSWFQLFKYGVYLAVLTNVILFFLKESNAAAHKFTNGIDLGELIKAYSSTIDTGSWVVLLLMFELETYILSAEQLKGKIKWLLRFLRTISYGFILYAFTGYWGNVQWVMDFFDINHTDLCQYKGLSWLLEVDQFKSIDASNCASLHDGTALFKKSDEVIYTNSTSLNRALKLAMTDLLNAGSWILVVLVLEMDVWLQLQNRLEGKIHIFSKYVKLFLYLILFGAAIYWGFQGSILEFWDAFLWILAFIFIENNIFGWQATAQETI